MARKLAHEADDTADPDEKGSIERRGYLKLGATASVAAFVTGTGFAGTSLGASDGAETYTVDFSEYAQ